jgi:sugar phosphate isomerase/epimerase
LERRVKAILIANEVGLKNVGVTIDIGHAFNAYENPAESLTLAKGWNRLFHIYVNDNFREWDDDMIVGSQYFLGYRVLLLPQGDRLRWMALPRRISVQG